jgi:hypothetical protein
MRKYEYLFANIDTYRFDDVVARQREVIWVQLLVVPGANRPQGVELVLLLATPS